MTRELYRYVFTPEVSMEEVEATLLLTLFAVESLHGEAQVRLDAAHSFDAGRRCCVLDAGTAVGRDLSRMLTGLITREFGADAFQVERLEAAPPGKPQEVPAAAP